ncbi:response regulator transcription factor [Anaerococcus sp. AGMB09787]|uniref:winged helix-turn-helix domain-containing protein n=1 Tax=Anaerococcus sp. AGMB09787 TaxID=2922869 RepID=UPI001FAEED66|nr:response regulator transcription factor [Anaerococcus sp. AGMB09787]
MIYVIEDDDSIRNLILYALREKGYEAKGFADGSNIINLMKEELPRLVLLDIMLPGKDGIEILKEIRNDNSFKDIAVIMLTAKSEEFDKVLGLDSGADDYVVKPFSVLELLSRIKAVLRRYGEDRSKKMDYKEISLDKKKRSVSISGKAIDLTYKEFEMLLYLMENPNVVITREDFLIKIWGYDYEGETRTVDVHIASLRNKLDVASKYIKTVRNLGYKFEE